jgi:14-3-3 protein epsilon
MVENMKIIASEDRDLTVEERNLLSVAYKNVIGARRASWRIVTSIEQKEESKGNSSQVGLIKEYRQKIEAELAKICDDILEVLDKHLIPSAKSGESKVFYHKMCVSESRGKLISYGGLTPSVGRVTTTATWPSSPLGTDARSLPISPSRLTRLRLRLLRLSCLLRTLSVLVSPSTSLCSIMRFLTPRIKLAIWPSRPLMMLLPVGCLHVHTIAVILIVLLELDTLSEESYKDSTLIMQLLRDNLVRL